MIHLYLYCNSLLHEPHMPLGNGLSCNKVLFCLKVIIINNINKGRLTFRYYSIFNTYPKCMSHTHTLFCKYYKNTKYL